MEYPLKIMRGGAKPPTRKGRRIKWHLPLAKLGDDDVLLVEMPESEARDAILSIRAAVQRFSVKTGIRFSVYLTESGVKIWRRTPTTQAEEGDDDGGY